MADRDFDEFQQRLQQSGVTGALEFLVQRLRAERKYHELFEAHKLLLRQRLGLPLMPSAADTQDAAISGAYEEGLIAACRDVGFSLLNEGRVREAWMYLRPVGDKPAILAQLNAMDVPEDRIDEVIEVCLYEGLDPPRAFRLMLEKYGTCNTLTTFDAQQPALDRATRQQVAAMLVRHLHWELTRNVKSHIERHEGKAPDEQRLLPLLEARPWLTAEGNYHIDVSHLCSTIRGARVLEDADVLQLAWELASYGARLDASLAYPDAEPFAEVYIAHGRYFDVLLGREVEQGLAYFEHRAENVSVHYEGTAAAEVYVDLLLRAGRAEQALEYALVHLPPGTPTRGIAPPLLEIARTAGRVEQVTQLFRENDDLLAFAAALLPRDAND